MIWIKMNTETFAIFSINEAGDETSPELWARMAGNRSRIIARGDKVRITREMIEYAIDNGHRLVEVK